MAARKDIRILCIDDYDTARKLLVKNLRELGFTGELMTAVDGKDGLEQLLKCYQNNTPVDFVISDFVMPEMNGLELLKAVRANTLFKELPFLMLTSEADRDTVMECLKYGTSNYLLKPWTIDTLSEKFEFCWKKHHG